MPGNKNSGRKKGKGLSPKVQEEITKKINGAKIINCLIKHVEGKQKMDASQVSAGLGLLKKIVPDLAATTVSGPGDDGDHLITVRKIVHSARDND